MKIKRLWKKRLLCVAIAVAMMVALLPTAVFAVDEAPDALNTTAQPTASATQEAQPTASATQEAQPTASATQEAQPTASATQGPQPTASATQGAQPTASATQEAQPTASATQGAQPDAAAATLQKSADAAMSTFAADPFVVKFFDVGGAEVPDVEIPNAVTLKVYDTATDTQVSTTNYDIAWFMINSKNEPTQLDSNADGTLTFPFTTQIHRLYTYQAVLTPTGSGAPIEVMAGDFLKSDPDSSTVLIVNQKPVLRGGAAQDGVSLSADGKTISMSGVNITDSIRNEWVGATVYMETKELDMTLEITGNNSIATTKNSGVFFAMLGTGVELEHTNLTVKGGGTLDLDVTVSDSTCSGFRVAGVNRPYFTDVAVKEGTTLKINTTTGVEGDYSEPAFSLYCGSLNLEDGKILAQGDSGATVAIPGIEGYDEDTYLYVGPNSELRATNSCTVVPPDDKPAFTEGSAIFFSGEEAVIDGGTVSATVENQTINRINAYQATFGETIVKNGGSLSATAQLPDASRKNQAVQVAAIATLSLIVQDASHVTAEANAPADSKTACWGIAFADLLAIRDGSTVDVTSNCGAGSGIEYGGPTNEYADEKGTIFVKNSDLNVTLNAQNANFTEVMNQGIWARYLKTEINNSDYAVEVNVTAANNNGSAVFLRKDNSTSPVSYNPFYVSQRLSLGELDGILVPENGNANLFSYTEGDPSINLVGEVIYGADKTKPAQQVKLSVYNYVYQEMQSTDGKVSITGNINRDATLSVTSDLHENCAVCDEIKADKLTKDMLFLGNISLDGTTDPYKGDLGLSFNVGATYNGKTVYLLHCVEKKAERMSAVVENGMANFIVSSLSPFALYAEPTPTPMTAHTVRATASAGGTISPSGDVAVIDKTNAVFTFTPDKGYKVASVAVDGQTVQTDQKTYTLANVTANHTIHVVFAKASPKTGDSADMTPYIWLLVIAAGATVGTFVYRKRKA